MCHWLPRLSGQTSPEKPCLGGECYQNGKRCRWVQRQEMRQRLPCAPLSRPAAFTAPAPGSLDPPWSLKAPGEQVPIQAPVPALELMPRHPQTT